VKNFKQLTHVVHPFMDQQQLMLLYPNSDRLLILECCLMRN